MQQHSNGAPPKYLYLYPDWNYMMTERILFPSVETYMESCFPARE